MLFLKEIFRKPKRTLENQKYNKRNNRRFRRKTGEKRKLKDHIFIMFTSSRQEKYRRKVERIFSRIEVHKLSN